jgi:hypothetical protein
MRDEVYTTLQKIAVAFCQTKKYDTTSYIQYFIRQSKKREKLTTKCFILKVDDIGCIKYLL